MASASGLSIQMIMVVRLLRQLLQQGAPLAHDFLGYTHLLRQDAFVGRTSDVVGRFQREQLDALFQAQLGSSSRGRKTSTELPMVVIFSFRTGLQRHVTTCVVP